MAHHEGREHFELGIRNAVETLTSIADLEIDSSIAIAEKHEIELQEVPVIYHTVHWLHKKNAEKVMSVVKDTFRVILNYLKYFYRREYGKLIHHESVEGIKTIMVLVGEAAKKVDKYSQLFIGATTNSIKKTKEFRDLWVFYQRKIAPIEVHESLTQWMKMLPLNIASDKMQKRGRPVLSKAGEELFIDLDTVKQDSEYELFLIRKEDGSRFFDSRLLRNVKLLCDFGEYYEDEMEAPSLDGLRAWKDLQAQFFARDMLLHSWSVIDQFVKNAHKYRNHELAVLSYRAVIALMLAANTGAVIEEFMKGSGAYLKDFQRFLRQILSSSDFHKLITYPSKNPESISWKIVQLVQYLCTNMYSGAHINQGAVNFIDDLINEGERESGHHESFAELSELPLSMRMAVEYDALVCTMRRYSHMPLIMSLESLQEGDIRGFDPLLLQNWPSAIFDLDLKGKKVPVLRIPSPCLHEHINKADVIDEFKMFLRGMKTGQILLFNLQDRTNWKEYARSHALEELQGNEEFHKSLCVVSLIKDGDFYHQTGIYYDLNHADAFIEQFLEHLQSENSGYFYPEKIKGAIFPTFASQLARSIHQAFFGKKNVLSRSNRCDFIELFYLFLQLKIIEVVQPSAISFSCKDAIDVGMVASCEVFLLLRFLNGLPLLKEEEEYMKVLLYAPAIAYRSRVLFEEWFDRFNSFEKLLEGSVDERKAIIEQIASLFDPKILSMAIQQSDN